MLIKWEDLRVGDEIIISSYSQLKYLKVLKLASGKMKTHKCSIQRGNSHSVTVNWSGGSYNVTKEITCQPDITQHNSTYYLKDEGIYRDIWLVKREFNG